MGTLVSVTGAYNKTEQDMKRRHLMAGLGALMVMGGCTPSSQVDNVAGQASVYEDPSSSGRVQGVGIESQDVVAMTDEMMRDMLSNRILAARDGPRIIIDNEYFKNESSSIINTNLLTDRLRVELNRAANGRMIFGPPLRRHGGKRARAQARWRRGRRHHPPDAGHRRR